MTIPKRDAAGEGIALHEAADFRRLQALRFGRLAAYALRLASLGWGTASIFEPPLTIGEVLSAIDDPDAPLADWEREAALGELIGEPAS